ncbi:MAG: dTDP-glucose 4,6-dehydratase [Candidatus Omnitrophota bacterium]|nr:MAG: dTDP-glucose 4,6-dehydratase [Candidatus Omnitrophota bacterium]
MRERIRKILVTGGCGFIGSAFVRIATSKGYRVVVIDKLTYAGDLARLKGVSPKYKFYKTDICDKAKVEKIFVVEKPSIVINFAAETHVDRSILDSGIFLESNLMGSQALLDIINKYEIRKFIQISTDEVYGEIIRGRFLESSPLRPNSPYAASKAAADLLISSYMRTYGFPALIVRPCNNYGPWQYPEKLIPLSILKIIKGDKIPLYGDGKNVRQWLYVDDCARGIVELMEKGSIGEIYNLSGAEELKNIEVLKIILRILNCSDSLIQFVKDRPGHDKRYSLNSQKISKLGFKPRVSFRKGIENTVNWCLEHKTWLLSKWKDIAPLYK